MVVLLQNILKPLLFAFFLMVLLINANGQNAEYINYEVINEIDEGGERITTVKKKLIIYNRKGSSHAQERIYSNGFEEILSIDAIIKDTNGKKIKKLKKRNIKETHTFENFYDDAKVYFFELRHIHYPYIFETEYQYKVKKYYSFYPFYPLFDELPVRNGLYTLNIHKSKEIDYKSYGLGNPKIISNENYKLYQWEVNNLEPIHKEDYMPPYNDILVRIEAIPLNFTMETKGSNTSWNALGNWYYTLYEKSTELPESEKLNIDQLLKNVKDDSSKIEILYNYLKSSTRYIAIEDGISGIKPYPAKHVSENKYGDCKGLCNFMHAMLKYIGIRSHNVLTYRQYYFNDIDTSFVSNQFNHVILMVALEKDTIWLECTSDYYPPGFIGYDNDNRHGLLLDKNESGLVKIPSMNKQNKRIRAFYINLGDVQENLAKVSLYCKGKYYQNMVKQIKKNKKEIKYSIHDRIPFTSFETKEHEYSFSSRSSIYNEKATLILKDYTSSFDENIIMYAPNFYMPVLDTNNRINDIFINYTYQYTDTVHYTFPTSWILKTHPENISIINDFGAYKKTLVKKNHTIHLVKSFKLNGGLYSKNEIIEFNKFLKNIKNAEKKGFVFSKSH